MAQAVLETSLTDQSLAVAISTYGRQLKEALVSKEAFEILESHALLFPLSITPFFCFEIPLHTYDRTADFLFCINDPNQLSNYFLNDHYASSFRCKEKMYEGLQNFSAFWLNAKPSTKLVNNIWFEFDFAGISRGDSTPSFFYAPDKGVNALAKVHMTDRVFNTITGEPLTKETAKTLFTILCNIPKPGWISQIGKMFARNDTSLRLFIQEIPKHSMGSFLKLIDYPYINENTFDSLLQNCFKFADQVDVDIDIDTSGQVGPVAGFECTFNFISTALAFLDHLYNTGICEQHKYIALYKFLKDMHSEPNWKYMPFLAHFKVVFNHGAATKAKVYIGYVARQQAHSIVRTKPVQ